MTTHCRSTYHYSIVLHNKTAFQKNTSTLLPYPMLLYTFADVLLPYSAKKPQTFRFDGPLRFVCGYYTMWSGHSGACHWRTRSPHTVPRDDDNDTYEIYPQNIRAKHCAANINALTFTSPGRRPSVDRHSISVCFRLVFAHPFRDIYGQIVAQTTTIRREPKH